MRTTLNILILALLVTAGCGGGGNDRIDGSDGGVLQPAGPTEVMLMPARSDYQVGETVVIDVVIRNADNVGSVPFHLRYDKGALEFLPPAVEGPWLGSDGVETVFLAAESSSGGELVVGASRFGGGVGIDGEGRLATFEFRAVGAGSSVFQFTGASVKDPRAQNLPAAFNTQQVRIAP